MLEPRPYQHAAIAAVRARFRAGKKSVLLQMQTGAGKTIVAAYVIEAAYNRGRRSLFVAGRVELIDQTVHKLGLAGLDRIRVIQASRDVGPKDAEVTVASIQTLVTDRWQEALPDADLLILDECHHGNARTWAGFLRRYPNAHKLGLSATPERADGKPLGDLFDSLVTGPQVNELIDLGHLVPCVVYPPTGGEKLDVKQVALDPVSAYQRHGEGERAIVFCTSVKHAQITSAEFNAAGIASAVIDGTMADGLRRATLARHRRGDLRVLCSIGVLTEGYDDPGVTVAILARGFGHPGLYLQCCGRVLRPFPGKTKAIIIDLVGSSWEHGTPDWEGRTYSLDGEAIKVDIPRDKIKQCKVCGAIFAAGRPCPNGCAQPAMPFAPPVNLGIGLVPSAGPVAPRAYREAAGMRAITASRTGRCPSCQSKIQIGEKILWAGPGSGHAIHSKCRAA